MLQRPSVKLPTRRLSQLTKTPTKSIQPITNNENENHSNLLTQHIFKLSESPPHAENEEEDGDGEEDSAEFVTSNLKNTENIQCMVRIRPILPETEDRGRVCVDLNSTNKMITIDCKPKQKAFTFDHVGGITSTQESIFQVVGKPITNACLSGYNGTIFAYGQTGSGKTFTILGDFENKNSSQRGLMPRVFDYLFSQIQRHRDQMGIDRVEYLVKCSCLEIYNERIQDLLEPDRCNLQVREDIKRGVVVEGLSHKICETANHALDLIQIATRNRRVSATSMNKESSRSHLMFSLLIECRITDETAANNMKNNENDDITKTPAFTRTRARTNSKNNNLVRTRTSRFNLVDLAGSERQSKTKAKGDRLREAGNINKSLTVLGHVMKALVQQNMENENKHRHIHYRDSKLTHLLKDSLGGNSLTFMIACVSPSSLNLLESLSTLQFASRAKYIKNKAQLNEDQSGSVQVLKMENLKLVNEVEKLRTLIRKQRKRKRNHQSMNASLMNGGDMDVDMEGSADEEGESADIDGDKLKDTIEILEGENYTIRREAEQCKTAIGELNKVIEKKQQFVMSLKMQLKLRETETVTLRDVIQERMMTMNGDKLRNDIIERYEAEEKERKMLLSDPSYVVEEHVKNLELQQQCQQMMDFIDRFVDDKDNKFRNDEYMKWKNMYQVMVDENEELRREIRSPQIIKMKEYEAKIESVKDDWKRMEEGYKQRMDGLQQEMNRVRESEQSMKNRHNDLENDYGELESKIQLEERKYLMEKEAMKEEYEKQLEFTRQGAVRALDSNNEESMKLKMDITRLTAKMEATEKALLESQSHQREQTKRLHAATAELEQKNAILDACQTRLEDQTQEMATLHDTIRHKDEAMDGLKGGIQGMVHEMAQKDARMEAWQSKQDEFESKIGEKHSNITRLEAELETVSQEFSDFKLQYSSLQEDHQILNDVHSTLEYQKREMDDKVERYLRDMEALKATNDGLTQAMAEQQNAIQNLESEVSKKMQSEDETVRNWKDKNEDLVNNIAEMNAEIESMKESLNESQNEQLRKDIDIEALRREMKCVMRQLSDYKSAHNELEEKYSGQLERGRELQQKCDTYNTSLIDKNIKLQRLLEENESLQTEMASLNEEHARQMGEKEKQVSEMSEAMAENESELKQEYETKLAALQENLMNIDSCKEKMEREYVLIEKKYAHEKGKLEEKEETISRLRKELSQFKCVTEGKEEIERQLAAVVQENTLAKATFEAHKKNMVQQLARAHADVEQRQNRSERLIATFEQRLELRQKQNVEYREKIDELSATMTAKISVIKKQNAEIAQIKDQLARCQHTVSAAQSLNETLLAEKAEFDNKLEARDEEIEEITMKHNKLQQDLTQCMEQRIAAIKTSKRMRSAEEKAFNEMLQWKTKYHDLEETSQRITHEIEDLKKENEKLAVENSKLAGHHNAQQRINHLLNLKKECEKLKREKKQYLNKICALQKQQKQNNVINLKDLDVSICSNATDTDELKEQLIQLSATKEEMAQIITKILNTIRHISQLSVVEDKITFKLSNLNSSSNVEHHLIVLNTIQNVIHDQNNQIIKLKRDIDGLNNDINIRNEQIKLLQDQIVLSPTLQTSTKQQRPKSNKRRSSSHVTSPSSNKHTKRSRYSSTDNFNFD